LWGSAHSVQFGKWTIKVTRTVESGVGTIKREGGDLPEVAQEFGKDLGLMVPGEGSH